MKRHFKIPHLEREQMMYSFMLPCGFLIGGVHFALRNDDDALHAHSAAAAQVPPSSLENETKRPLNLCFYRSEKARSH